MDAAAAPGLPPMAKAFRHAYEQAGHTQETLSAATGIDQSLISKYARGAVHPPLDVLPKVDEACGQPLGHVLRLAGYVADDRPDVLAAIEQDPAVTDDIDRECLRAAYRLFRTRPGGEPQGSLLERLQAESKEMAGASLERALAERKRTPNPNPRREAG